MRCKKSGRGASVCSHEERVARLTQTLRNAEREHEEERRTLQNEFESERKRLERELHHRELEHQQLEESKRTLQKLLEEQQQKNSSLQEELFSLQHRQLSASCKKDRVTQTSQQATESGTQTEALVMDFVNNSDQRSRRETTEAEAAPSERRAESGVHQATPREEDAIDRLVRRASNRSLASSSLPSSARGERRVSSLLGKSSLAASSPREAAGFSFEIRQTSLESADNQRGSTGAFSGDFACQPVSMEDELSLSAKESVTATAASPEDLALKVKSLTERALARRYKFQKAAPSTSSQKEGALSPESRASEAPSPPRRTSTLSESGGIITTGREASLNFEARKESNPPRPALRSAENGDSSECRPRLSLLQKQSLLEQLAKSSEQIRLERVRPRSAEERRDSAAKSIGDSLQASHSSPTPAFSRVQRLRREEKCTCD